jgi:hypothetical protein
VFEGDAPEVIHAINHLNIRRSLSDLVHLYSGPESVPAFFEWDSFALASSVHASSFPSTHVSALSFPTISIPFAQVSGHDPESEVFPSNPGIVVVGSDFLRAAALGERLRLSLLVMSESGVPIYQLESKSVLRYSRKWKDAQLNKSLIAESLAAFTFSPPPLGLLSWPTMETVAAREPSVSFVRCGFLLPRHFRWEDLRGEVILKRLLVLSGQCLMLSCAFKLWRFPLRGTRKDF